MVALLMAGWVAAAMAAAGPADSTIAIEVFPSRPLLERGDGTLHLNFDFRFVNRGDRPREIRRIEVSAFDPDGRLIFRQFISSSGAASPGLLTVPDRTIPAGGSLSLFNPFHSLPGDLTIDRLRYQFTFEVRGIEPVASATIEVRPRDVTPATRLTLPVDGPAIVYDGHDFYSHHRRIPLGGELARRFKLTTNPVRYANDWSPVGPDGELARGSLAVPANWYAFGATVRAPAAGVVVSVANDVPDNRIEGGDSLVVPPEVAADLQRASLGNHLIIAHRDGEYSVLAHLKIGSIALRVGDSVRSGAAVGQIGFSGDTGFHVHLHHMLVTEPGMTGEGLPTYFDRVRRVAMGGGARPFGPILSGARLDTGDLVIRVP